MCYCGYRVWDELEITLILVFWFAIRLTVEVRDKVSTRLRVGMRRRSAWMAAQSQIRITVDLFESVCVRGNRVRKWEHRM